MVGLRFGVEAYHSELNGWRVKVCATRDGDDYNGVVVCSVDELESHPPKSHFSYYMDQGPNHGHHC